MINPRIGYFIVFAGIVVFILTQFRWDSEVVEFGWQAEAHFNPYKAAESYLQRLGGIVETSRDTGLFSSLPSHDDLMFVASDRIALSGAQVDDFLKWIEQGGKAVIAAQNTWFESENSAVSVRPDLLLDAFGVAVEARQASDLIPLIDNEGNTVEQRVENCSLRKKYDEGYRCPIDIEQRLVRVSIGDEDEVITLLFESEAHFIVKDTDVIETQIGTIDGPQLLQFRYGEGLVTLIIDDGIWRNHALKYFDHGLLLGKISQSRRKIWLIYSMNQGAHWVQLLWANAWPLVVSGLLTLFAFIWTVSVRFGSIAAPADSRGRDIVDHIEATARFVWKAGGESILLASLQRDVLIKANKRLPNFNYLTQHEQADRLVFWAESAFQEYKTKLNSTEIEGMSWLFSQSQISSADRIREALSVKSVDERQVGQEARIVEQTKLLKLMRDLL